MSELTELRAEVQRLRDENQKLREELMRVGRRLTMDQPREDREIEWGYRRGDLDDDLGVE